MCIEIFADEAVGFAKAKLPILEDLKNPLLGLRDVDDPIGFVIQAWSDQYPGIRLPDRNKAKGAVISALINDCPSLREFFV